ncbi:NUDIX domain-containing protein [Desulfuromonas thiophila]|uniref:Mutator mutT protein n=1 Tax=Desulfuromonas thiophila TaxID=57664 RepID=A0A1G6ZP98_9BACT|nr:NUDIX hydrolase [Desulfuromonas thiophila]SDE04341.1 mutator mutT protein [Desulfuromonas thiophila]
MQTALQPAIKTSVVACIIDSQSRILLTRRSIPPFFGQWVMPGGKIDHGESIASALQREVQEEVGLQVEPAELVDIYEHLAIGHKKDHYIILYYRARPLTLQLRINPAELSEAVWFEADHLPTLDVPPGCRQVLARLYPEVNWPRLQPPGDDADCEIPGLCPLP